MKQRCINPSNQSYHWYGGRGIKFQKSWSKYSNFLEDLGICPDGLTLERIDPNGDYCKENCKWIPLKEQVKNKRNSRKNRKKFIYSPLEKLCVHCKSDLIKEES